MAPNSAGSVSLQCCSKSAANRCTVLPIRTISFTTKRPPALHARPLPLTDIAGLSVVAKVNADGYAPALSVAPRGAERAIVHENALSQAVTFTVTLPVDAS